MINSRLKEERERLGYTQPVFAEFAGTKKRTMIDWEKGVSSPTAVQLAALASVGVDVLYVLTGERSQTQARPNISAKDRALLNNFHSAPKQVQVGVETTLGAFSPTVAVPAKHKAAA